MSVSLSQLPNGLRVVTNHMPGLETVSLGVWVGVGARAEEQHEHGISHLLEHMAFKGTPTRSAKAIAEEIEAVGGDLNAGTSLENTSYFVRILRGDEELAIALLSDILQNPLFDEEELLREKDVVLQEIAGVQDSPDDLAYDLVQSAAYPSQPVGRPILGTEHSVMSATSEALKKYMESHYTADRMVVSAAGSVDHEAIHALAEKYFSGLKPSAGRTFEKATYKGGAKRSTKDFEQSHLILAFEGASFNDTDFYTAQVLSGLLGGGMSSRLFQEVREKRGLCYAIYSFSWGLSDTGLFGIHAATGSDQIAELANVLTDELTKVATANPAEAELSRSKAQLKAGLMMSLESSGARAEQLARQTLAFGAPLQTKDLIDRVETVSAEDIRSVAEKILTGSKPTFATVGSIARPDALESISFQL